MATITTVRERRRVAVVGGGINGAGIAWELARRDYEVVLFEKGAFGAATSSATTKMVHGGLRYLENLEWRLVREALLERAFLLKALPELVRPLPLVVPHFRGAARPRWMVRAGLLLYDRLAGRENIAPHESLSRAEVLSAAPLRGERLRGGFRYWDAQVDDAALVRSVVASAVDDGVDAREATAVESLKRKGRTWLVRTAAGEEEFDVVVNAAGPWMGRFLERNGIETDCGLTLVRGSHIVLSRSSGADGVVLQVPGERRIIFILPWKEETLVGTTEVMHRGSLDEVSATEREIDYLLGRFNRFFREPAERSEISDVFAGVRPLLSSRKNPTAITREYRIEEGEAMVNVFGGKLTTFMALSRSVADAVDRIAGAERIAREPIFARSAVESPHSNGLSVPA
jgi:glycerol-3-phosphate dehydrogenase